MDFYVTNQLLMIVVNVNLETYRQISSVEIFVFFEQQFHSNPEIHTEKQTHVQWIVYLFLSDFINFYLNLKFCYAVGMAFDLK